jgi:hypothetical protein
MTEQGTRPIREPRTENAGLSTQDVWTLVEIVKEREAFRTACGMTGRSVLDYPGGFKFGDPVGLLSGVSGTRWFHAMEPSFVVWSDGGLSGRTYTIAWYSELEKGWNHPSLARDAPVEVRRHQWLMRVLTFPMPDTRLGVDF